MDATRFDNLARALQRHTPRRSALRALGGGLATLLTRLGIDDAAAMKKKRKHKKKCAKAGQKPKKKKRCCKGLSKDTTGRCAKPCDVCQPAGACRYDSVQAAVDDATPGATLTLCAGTFTETIEIAKSLTLIGMGDGTGPGNTILDRAGAGTVVFIGKGSIVTLRNLRITGGNTSSNGGGIFNLGTLVLIGCSVIGNKSNFTAGGIYSLKGTLALINSTVSGNTSTNISGGIDNFQGTLELIGSRVTANSAGNSDGGIRNEDGTVICRGSNTVSGNTAGNPPEPSNCIDVGGGTGCATCPD